MPDDTNTPTPGNGTPPDGSANSASGGDDAITLTKSELEATIKDAQSKAFAAAFAEAKRRAGSATPPPKGGDKPSAGSGEDRYARLLSQRDALDDVLTAKTVTVDQRRMLRDMMAKVDPDDAHAWAESVVSTFLSPSTTTNATNNTSNASGNAAGNQGGTNGAADPTKRTGSTPAPAGSKPDADTVNDVTKWNRDVLSAYVRDKGGNPHQLNDPRNRKVLSEIRAQWESRLAERFGSKG